MIDPLVDIGHEIDICQWQEREALALGSEAQRQLYASGELSEVDLTSLARNALFAPCAALRLRRQMPPTAIRHPVDSSATGRWTCAPDGRRLPVRWSTRQASVLTESELAALSVVEIAVAEINHNEWLIRGRQWATIQPRLHQGTCEACLQSAAETSVLISVPWAGRTLSREYAL